MTTADIPVGPPIAPTCSDCWTTSAPGRLTFIGQKDCVILHQLSARLSLRQGHAQFVPWDKEFFDPVILPSGRKLVTLRDTALYITKLPKAEHATAEWRAAKKRRCG